MLVRNYYLKNIWKVCFLTGLLLTSSSLFAKSVTLNMKGADINAVISTVAEATGKNFIIDPRVKGKVTIISTKPLNKDQLYQVFLAILDVHGFTAVQSGNNVIKIIPDSDAKHNGTPSEGVGEEMITQVVEIKHIAAAQLVPILRPLVPPQGHLAAHAQTNVLIIADRVSNINRLLKIIEKIDEPSSSEIEIVQLQHASASEVVRVLTTLQQKNQKSQPKTNSPTLVADERTNSILMGGDKTTRLGLKALIAHLDTPSEMVGNTHVIYLHYAKAKDLVSVLTGVGKIKAKAGGKSSKAQRSSSNGNFDIQADESSNTLVITAAPDIYRSLVSVIKKLDVRRAQVMVEAIIAEISANKTNELGIQWFGDGSQSGVAPIGATNFGSPSIADVGAAAAAVSAGTVANPASLLGSGLTLGVGRLNSDTLNFGVLLRALAATSAANLLSTPNIVTMDNEEAEIFVGQEVSVPTGSFTQTSSSSSNPFTTFKSKQVGIRLKVKPQINEGNAIRLDIEQTVDAITAGQAGTAGLVTSQRTIKTSVMVEDSEVIALGGLIADDETKTVQKVPLLGDIPLLGALFRYKNVVKDKKNLMVFLHPTILRDAATNTIISGSKYRDMRTLQMMQRNGSNMEKIEKEIAPIMPKLEDIISFKKKLNVDKKQTSAEIFLNQE
ncbi:MAG: type II secretion system secretin GspD [Gammaproteobacteria bacterium]|nr:type II secretion system secretin GspD [Gammaproteobacteria bacterium]